MKRACSLLLGIWIFQLTLPLTVVAAKKPRTSATAPHRVEKSDFGRLPDGREVAIYTLKNKHGMVAKVTAYGASLTELQVPDRNGKFANVVLGFDNLPQYLGDHPVFGATVGRFANRIRNASFNLDGKVVRVTPNAGKHHIHGGKVGFNRVLWKDRSKSGADRASVVFTYHSKDGEEGFPGNMVVTVTYTLTDQNELRLDYGATTDQPTVINLTNHTYFNLSGNGDVLDQVLRLFASHYTPADASLIPIGGVATVDGTPVDFTKPTPIGRRIQHLYEGPGGYDHNFVVDGEPGVLRKCARVADPHSGRVMTCSTTEPGVQLYTANGLNGRTIGARGVSYPRHAGFTLETQHYPDSPNQPNFASPILRPGSKFHSTTTFRFSVEK